MPTAEETIARVDEVVDQNLVYLEQLLQVNAPVSGRSTALLLGWHRWIGQNAAAIEAELRRRGALE